MNKVGIAILLALVFGGAHRSYGQVLSNRAFDIVLVGDDPGEFFEFNLPGNPLVPCLVTFNGVFQNQDPVDTSARYELTWSVAESALFSDSVAIPFTALSGAGQLPVQLAKWIWFTPRTVVLGVEGGGPTDNLRFRGDITIQQITALRSANCLPPHGIKGWWPGDSVTNDVVGRWPATLRGGAGFGPGLVREAFTLNGNGQFVEVPADPRLNVGTSDFTIELWVRFNTLDGEQVIAEKFVETMSVSTRGWTVTKLPNNVVRLALGAVGNVDSAPAGSITAGAWTHLAARRSGQTFTVFQNGSPAASGNFTVNLDSTSSLKFGHRGNPSDTPGSSDTRDFWLNGAIDEPALYNRALSDQEIASIFQAGALGKCRRPVMIAFVPPASGLVRVTVKGIAGLPHVLEGSTDLINWSPLTTNVPATEIFELGAPEGTVTERFHRVVEVR
jgi:concanavalin A-like lectin/glucanase superfamily protein